MQRRKIERRDTVRKDERTDENKGGGGREGGTSSSQT
jgi:hypothetical protein